ncbi:efflux transporter periplasmic adaptor subunit [Bradyrhizobium sp. Leo170]|nr:efflux transporter periplasmic adaptor subunit [Bradyrhizobium sp. Leo170]
MLAACGPNAAVPPADPTVSVSTPLVKEVTGWDTFTGRLEAVDTVEVRPRVNGYVERVAFRDGDYVHKGDLLFVIDPRPYEAAEKQAEGQLAQAQAQLVLADKELERAKSLIAAQAIATNVLDQRAQNQQAAEAAVAVAAAALARANLDLDFTQVRAPITGRISRKLVSEGNLVAGGDANATLLTSIVSLDAIDAYFDIDEHSFLRYRRAADGKQAVAFASGGEVGIALPGDKSPGFTGKLNFAENRLDASTGTLRLRARIANLDHVLMPGQFVRISLPAEPAHQAVLVPAAAVASDSSQAVLFVVGSDDRIAARPVELGRLFGKMREVTRGLEPNDRVVLSGIQRVQAGTKVTVRMEAIKFEQFASKGDVL